MIFIAQLFNAGNNSPIAPLIWRAIEYFQELKIGTYQKQFDGVGTFIQTSYFVDPHVFLKNNIYQIECNDKHGHFKNGKWIPDCADVIAKEPIRQNLFGKDAYPTLLIIHHDLMMRLMLREHSTNFFTILETHGIKIHENDYLVGPTEFMLARYDHEQYLCAHSQILKELEVLNVESLNALKKELNR